jgi:hypothetical protein
MITFAHHGGTALAGRQRLGTAVVPSFDYLAAVATA